MSERESTHGIPHASSARNDSPRASQSTSTSAPLTQSLQRSISTSHLSDAQRPSLGPSRGLELPPLSRSNAVSPGGISPSATTRIAGVSSILNPPEDEAQTGQRRKASQLTSPGPSAQPLPPLAPSIRGASRAVGASGQPGLSPRPSRRILTPRSPSGLHRAASLGQLNPQAGSINAQQVPFPPSPRGVPSARAYTVEPGSSGAPPLPTPPARAYQTGYGFPAPSTDAARRASTGTNRARNLSSSASPSTSYSSYSQVGQTSPIGQYASLSGGPRLPTYGADPGRMEQTPASQAGGNDSRQMGIPISSSAGPNVYQMMTLETTSGTVQLPVDVQAASRVADEKRRRNAGASARFRQRRKEKEKEASTSIARLEQQVKEMTEDAEFYRNDRANLLSILRGIPGTEHHLQRPPSPRQLRGNGPSMQMSSMSRRASYMRPPGSEPQSPESGRNVRRRTSTFSLPAMPSSQLPPPPVPPMQPSYPPSAYNTPIAPHPSALPPLPSPSQRGPGPQQPPLGPPPVMQLHPQTGPFNPYERKYSEPGPKDGR